VTGGGSSIRAVQALLRALAAGRAAMAAIVAIRT
jgi:hypothetical protein